MAGCNRQWLDATGLREGEALAVGDSVKLFTSIAGNDPVIARRRIGVFIHRLDRKFGFRYPRQVCGRYQKNAPHERGVFACAAGATGTRTPVLLSEAV